MHKLVKICVIFVFVNIQIAQSYPQFSIPFVSISKNRDKSSNIPVNIKIEHPLGSINIFGKGNTRQQEKTYNDNEKKPLFNVKIITVTPHNHLENKNEKHNIFQSNNNQNIYDKEIKYTDNNLEETTETIDTTTDYESTTYSDDDIKNRVSGNVVASLLG